MTEAFIKFYESNCPDINVNDEEVHAWLSAFVREYRERTRHIAKPDGQIFDELVEDFGLEEK